MLLEPFFFFFLLDPDGDLPVVEDGLEGVCGGELLVESNISGTALIRTRRVRGDSAMWGCFVGFLWRLLSNENEKNFGSRNA